MDGIQENNKKMRLKLSIKNHLNVLKSKILATLILFFILLILNFDTDFIIIGSLFFLITIVPAIYLHFEYFTKNFGCEIEISDQNIIIIRKNQKIIFIKSDITKVILYKSANMSTGGLPLYSLEQYYYIRLVLKSNEEIIISSLLINDLNCFLSEFKGIEFERKKRFFCSLNWK